MNISIKQFFYFGVAAIAVLVLADYLPHLAVVLMLLLIAGVVLNHWQDYAGYLNIPGSSKG